MKPVAIWELPPVRPQRALWVAKVKLPRIRSLFPARAVKTRIGFKSSRLHLKFTGSAVVKDCGVHRYSFGCPTLSTILT
jgi:hypothetical protein